MDCLRIQEILSEAADGGPIPTDLLAEATTHAATCERCATFARGLGLLQTVTAPAASTRLVDSALASIAAERNALRTETTTAEAGPAEETPTRRPHEPGGRDLRVSWWAPRLTVFATAAVFMLAALTLSAIGYFGGFRQLAADKSGETASTAIQESADDRVLGGTSEADTATMNTPDVETPAYASVDDRVFRRVGALSVDEGLLVIVGPVAGRSQADTTAPVYAYDAGAKDGSVVVEEPDIGWVAYEPVVRRFASYRYQLRTRTPLTVPGQWPDLPAAYPTPASIDGSPTFRFFGYDELGVRVFVPVAGDERDGFSVAPGSPTDDPAAGNPNWTWWAPLP
ncbi:MAG: hypothetical protein Q7J82_04050 [Coriobacteriia bacterium]|nr:hypothetical protein [Coriobacteriia bacterium]